VSPDTALYTGAEKTRCDERGSRLISPCLTCSNEGSVLGCTDVIAENGLPRYLTPVEYERLQDLPDNWTQIACKGKPTHQCPPSLRKKSRRQRMGCAGG